MATQQLHLLLVLLVLTLASATNSAGPLAPPNSDYRWASPEAVERWHDMKFGLRIHWGSYAVDGIGPESWPLNQNKNNASFLKWYWEQAPKWSPDRFQPRSWIDLMTRAGIKFFDFTTKHHEGFSMFNTSTRVHDCWHFDGPTGFNGIGDCPTISGGAPGDGIAFSSAEVFNRDITGELIEAAREGGVTPGLYFSHIDWFDADMRIDQWNPLGTGLCNATGAACNPSNYSSATMPEQWERFVLRHRAQVIEVLTKYGEVAEMSFDMNFPAEFDSAMFDTVMLAREVAPNTLFRGRGMGGYKGECNQHTTACGMGDYETPEEQFPDKPIAGNWQVIYHGSNFMSFDPDPANYQNGSFIIWHLVDIVAKGGLMQIGYGPDARGEFHPKAVEALEYAGRWLDTNGEAIYGTRAMSDHWNDTASTMVRYTRSKDESIVYATVLSGFGSFPLPADHTLPLACVTPKVGSMIYLLGYQDEATRMPISVQWKQTGSLAVISVPTDVDQHPSVMSPGMVFKIQVK